MRRYSFRSQGARRELALQARSEMESFGKSEPSLEWPSNAGLDRRKVAETDSAELDPKGLSLAGASERGWQVLTECDRAWQCRRDST